jgi:hypothetical protein
VTANEVAIQTKASSNGAQIGDFLEIRPAQSSYDPYIDFNSRGMTNGFDTRLQISGGVEGTSGRGQLRLTGALNVSGALSGLTMNALVDRIAALETSPTAAPSVFRRIDVEHNTDYTFSYPLTAWGDKYDLSATNSTIVQNPPRISICYGVTGSIPFPETGGPDPGPAYPVGNETWVTSATPFSEVDSSALSSFGCKLAFRSDESLGRLVFRLTTESHVGRIHNDTNGNWGMRTTGVYHIRID